jgi:hypothetical protein
MRLLERVGLAVAVVAGIGWLATCVVRCLTWGAP